MLKPTSQAVADFEAFVITGDSGNFSVGANLMQLLLFAAQDQEWTRWNWRCARSRA